ncbi:MAG TPA: hypothetical protein ENG47_01705 [Candidatus Aerophobetes bacterium]|uniref:Calcineurin-like phosphoesterase domain-containing protein n=1 Tax=Aerophobetes bacterium TaxID=2030807 RepID=A0A7V0MZC0_UNCAE|nr:hypothetical protein [Candidatus Aerophobetes bacterium]
MQIKLVHTADIHLKREDPFRLNILSWIISKTKELADGLIIAGDLFENNTEASFLRGSVREIFEKIQNLPIFIVPGNHDYSSYSPDTFYGENVVVFNSPAFHIIPGGMRIIGIPFKPGSDFSTLIEKIKINPDTDIVITHGTLYDRESSRIYTELGEDAKYMPVYKWDIENKMRYLALGHFKRSEPVRIERIPVEISPYWKKIEWMVFPGKEEKVVKKIEKDIQKARGTKTMLDGHIKGSIAISEIDFREKIREIEQKYQNEFKLLELQIEVSYWTDILKNPTIASFVEKLEKVNRDDSVKQRALELTLSALEKLRV